ncbi:MAG TPA: hypothetical protein VEI03_11985 [Stellaceae bacterium]|nr:hypothetical protein [Stellaceae bacterium]
MIDGILRRLRGIIEFEAHAGGLFRIELGRAGREFFLSDGTHLHRGDVVIELHLWNEHVLPAPLGGIDFGWAVRLRRQTLATLGRLALHLREDPRLAEAQAIRMQPAAAAGWRPDGALARVLLKIGFEPVEEAAPEERSLHRFLDDLWLWLLTWSHNPRVLKGRRFRRKRRAFWISRRRFLALYAEGRSPPANADPRDRSPDAPAKKSATLGGHRAG